MFTDTQLKEEFERDPVWGPMSHPAKDSVPEGSPPWKDHIYLTFWDSVNDVWGYFHWNNSPNHDTTKAHICLQTGGKRLDHREPLPPSTTRFKSASLDYDLASHITVHHERLSGELVVSPRFTPVDYNKGVTIMPNIATIEESRPPEHFQQGLTLKGELRFDGEPVTFDALGLRTRTFGHRDDSNQFMEYISICTSCADYDVTAMKFKQHDGSMVTNGAITDNDGQVRVSDLHVVRDPRGLPLRLILDLEDGRELPLRWGEVPAEFWCPIGPPERDGQTFSAYDQWMQLDTAGEESWGMSEQAIVRTVF
jgi:hypothetical protein